jgi:hypothetical protein
MFRLLLIVTCSAFVKSAVILSNSTSGIQFIPIIPTGVPEVPIVGFGEHCGGLLDNAPVCDFGLVCVLTISSPDTGGTCQNESLSSSLSTSFTSSFEFASSVGGSTSSAGLDGKPVHSEFKVIINECT